MVGGLPEIAVRGFPAGRPLVAGNLSCNLSRNLSGRKQWFLSRLQLLIKRSQFRGVRGIQGHQFEQIDGAFSAE